MINRTDVRTSAAEQKRFCDTLHKTIPLTYRGVQVSHLVEKPVRQLFLEKHAGTSFGWPQLLLHRLSSMRSWLNSSSGPTSPPWQEDDLVFLAGNENSLLPMARLSPYLRDLGMHCMFVVPAKAKSWSDATRGIPGPRFSIHPSRLGTKSKNALSYSRDFRRLLEPFIQEMLGHQVSDRERKTRCFLVQNAVYTQIAWIEQIEDWIQLARPKAFISDRPKGTLPLSYMISAHLKGVPNVFMPHIILRELPLFRPAFYDLGLNSIAIVFSRTCETITSASNPEISTIVSGLPQVEGDCSPYQKPANRLVVGYPAGYDYAHLRRIAGAAENARIKLLVKGRPPGGDKELLADAVAAGSTRSRAAAFPHEELSLTQFLSEIDVLICGRSNVGFHAAAIGIPIIWHPSEDEIGQIDTLGTGLEVRDIAATHAPRKIDLEATLCRIRTEGPYLVDSLARRQRALYKLQLPTYDGQNTAEQLKLLLN